MQGLKLGLDALKEGNLYERFLYFYVTRLKKYAAIRWARIVIVSPIEYVLLGITGFVCFLILCVALPILYWKTKREQEEYERQYQNRDIGWHSNP